MALRLLARAGGSHPAAGVTALALPGLLLLLLGEQPPALQSSLGLPVLLLPSPATAVPRAEAAQPLAQLDLLYMENKCILASSSEELHEGATA